MEPVILIEELDHGREALVGLLAGIPQADAQVKPDEKTRSILEVVCHLLDEEREDFRVRLGLMLEHPNEAWPPIRPEAWVTERAYNQRDLGITMKRFSEEREKSLEWLRSLGPQDWEVKCATPFGEMKPGDMLAAWVAHDNLHMRQLVELRRWRIEQISQPFDLKYAGDW